MNELKTITINNTDISVKEYQGKRVVTLKEIDQCHNRPEGTARRNFNKNKQHLIEGVDYFTVSLTTNEIRTQFGAGKNAGKTMTVVTESGYLMLVKSFTDDLAWDVQR
ncbi:MAG: ORF6N domain-containing protein [Ruminococcus sp.]|nr:ORF6N domain-containing protein [Ruminococcus sp.]